MQRARLITALATPFLDDRLDLEGFEANLSYQMESGVEGLLVLGTTGESPSLTGEERRQLIRTAVQTAGGRALVLAGTGTNSTRSTIELTREAKELGVDAALVVSPYYNCPNQRGLYEHFEALCKAVDLPICLYDIPKRTGCSLSLETLLKLADLPGVIGMKDSSGDLGRAASLLRILAEKRPEFSLWSGDDALLLPLMSLGAAGLFSVASNLFPSLVVEAVHAAWAGDFQRARERFFLLQPLLEALFIETNPIPVKAAMQLLGMASGPCRLPLGPLSEESGSRLSTALDLVLEGRALARRG